MLSWSMTRASAINSVHDGCAQRKIQKCDTSFHICAKQCSLDKTKQLNTVTDRSRDTMSIQEANVLKPSTKKIIWKLMEACLVEYILPNTMSPLSMSSMGELGDVFSLGGELLEQEEDLLLLLLLLLLFICWLRRLVCCSRREWILLLPSALRRHKQCKQRHAKCFH